MDKKISLIGFGEAGRTFTRAGKWASRVSVFDIMSQLPASRSATLAEYDVAGVNGCSTSEAALSGAALILSLVTADQAFVVARDAAKYVTLGALYCDMNSVAPQTKRAAAKAVEAAGGRYVDVAIMAPVEPDRLAVPLLISGSDAEAARCALTEIGFTNCRVVGDVVGRASVIKMLRSIIYKGMEALTAECVMACHRADVLDEVLGSLGDAWTDEANYRLDRMLVHGSRRAAEMDEVVKTLESLGVAPVLSKDIVRWQREIGALGIVPPPPTLQAKLKKMNSK